MYYSKSKLNHALDSETQKSELYLLRVWIFFIYDQFMDYPPRNSKPVHGSRNKDLIFKTTVAKNRKEKLQKSLVLLPAFCTNMGRRAEIA